MHPVWALHLLTVPLRSRILPSSLRKVALVVTLVPVVPAVLVVMAMALHAQDRAVVLMAARADEAVTAAAVRLVVAAHPTGFGGIVMLWLSEQERVMTPSVLTV